MSANPRQPDSPPTLNMASGPSAPSAPPDNAHMHSHVDDAKDVLASTADDLNDNAKQQEEPTKVTTLNEGELKALLDEALTYKCPKDRVGKSNLFKELLQEVEADENEEGRRAVTISRYLPGSNRRRHKRDSVSEPLTHGGSLQNLVQPVNSEFESFAYLNAGSSQNCGRRKGRKSSTSQSSVSARQREGGSLPSNVNATHTLVPLASRFDLIFDKKTFADETSSYNWTKKESQIQEKKSNLDDKKEEKEDKDLERRGPNMLISAPNNTSSDYQKPECMVIDLSSIEISYQVNSSSSLTGASNAESMMAQSGEEGGIEMKVIEPRGSAQYVSTLDIPQTPVETAVDTFVKFPLHESAGSDNRTRVLLNDADTSTLPFQYNNMRVFSGPSNGFAGQSNKNIGNVYSVVPFLPRSSGDFVKVFGAMEEPSEKKSFDENGNALHGYNTERKKARRKHTQEPNVIIYQSEHVQGHRNDDIESLVNFIENTSKTKRPAGKNGAGNSNTMRVKSTSGNSKSRSRDKESTKREQMANNLQRCNSLEEVSKTKLEDLTVEKSTVSNPAKNVYQHEPPNSADSLIMGKGQNEWDKSNSGNRGDRRSWGTEDGQFIYYNNSSNDYKVLRSSTNKLDVEYEGDTEFLVVSKKKKSKKRRSSSGSRAQQLSDSGVYLQSSNDFYPRAQLSNELRRKSASSMPPSDKSDSSDVDSVHSLPVTSNSSQHVSKMPSGNSPAQASYAEITRMAAMNVSADNVSVLNSSGIAGCNLSRTAASTPFESKFHDYPSLDEVQSVDRKSRQHQFVRSSNRGMNHSFDSNATLLKYNDKQEKSSSVEAINKVYHSLADTDENMTRQNMNVTAFSSASSTSEEASSLEFGVKSPPPADAKVKIETDSYADDKSAAKAKSTKVTRSVARNVPPVKSRKSSNSRPPVILLDEVICGSSKENDSSSELTFGFDINEQLLRNEEEKVSEVVPTIAESSVDTVVEKSAEKNKVDKAERKIKLKIVEALVIEDFCARFEQPPDKVFNFNNMEKVISHHKTAWNDMIQSNHVQFYSGQ